MTRPKGSLNKKTFKSNLIQASETQVVRSCGVEIPSNQQSLNNQVINDNVLHVIESTTAKQQQHTISSDSEIELIKKKKKTKKNNLKILSIAKSSLNNDSSDDGSEIEAVEKPEKANLSKVKASTSNRLVNQKSEVDKFDVEQFKVVADQYVEEFADNLKNNGFASQIQVNLTT
jgi:hypothetical protein